METKDYISSKGGSSHLGANCLCEKGIMAVAHPTKIKKEGMEVNLNFLKLHPKRKQNLI